MKICTVKDMKDLDQRAVAEYGISEQILMENAGEAVFFVLQTEIGIENLSFVIVCGTGNNGGDGLVVARKLHSNYAQVTIFIVGDPKKFKGAARVNYEIVSRLPIELHLISDITSLRQRLKTADCVVDAIFGTGLDRSVTGIYKNIIELINQNVAYTVSVDIPSGVNGNTAQIMGCAVEADYTVTFGLPKIGNLLYPGYEYCGKLFVTHISFPPEMYRTTSSSLMTNDPLFLPPRRGDAHKGTCGKVLFIAGSAHYLGAPYFAAQSFLRAGGGLSFLATPDTVSSFIGTRGSEIVLVPLKSTPQGSISLENSDFLCEFADGVDMVVIGPGLSLHEETQKLVKELAGRINKPILLDGDGITAISADAGILKKRKNAVILTPHIGEMARLADKKVSDIEENRIEILREAAGNLNSMIALKGAHTLIGLKDGRVYFNLTGNPGMATAGSGDVLTGTVAALFGLGLGTEDALRMGVFVHGLAGDIAAQNIGQDGIIAGDIMDALPLAMRRFRDELAQLYENYYQHIRII